MLNFMHINPFMFTLPNLQPFLNQYEKPIFRVAVQDKVTPQPRPHWTGLEIAPHCLSDSKSSVVEHFQLFIIICASFSKITLLVQRFESMHHNVVVVVLNIFKEGFLPCFYKSLYFSGWAADKECMKKIVE